MASQTQENYSCPICHDIFRDPVLLSCSHSFCEACWQRCWTEDRAHQCPVCKTTCLQRDPPRNLALKAVCEDFLTERAQRASAGAEPLCSLHSKKLKLFCLVDQQLVCSVCMHSEIHTNHSVRPIDEAVRDYKCGLQDSLDDLREKLELFNDIKRNFDQSENGIELQNTDIERQIKDVFSKLQQILQREERFRITALSEEKQWKSQMLRTKIEALNTQIVALSATTTATEEALRAEDLCFLQNYKTTAERVNQPLPDVPKPMPALLDKAKHLNNLASVVLDKMKEMITPKNTEPCQGALNYLSPCNDMPRNRFSLAQTTISETPGLQCSGFEPEVPLLRAHSTQGINLVHPCPQSPESPTGKKKKFTFKSIKNSLFKKPF